jgi:hypothetical protein
MTADTRTTPTGNETIHELPIDMNDLRVRIWRGRILNDTATTLAVVESAIAGQRQADALERIAASLERLTVNLPE